MSLTIVGSVGQGGMNRSGDVEVIQSLLNRTGKANLTISGKSDNQTIAAIRSFQQGFLKIPDGRVDVGGTTWKKLIEAPRGSNSTAKSFSNAQRNDSIIAAVDSDPALSGAGIVLIDAGGSKTEVRGGPRKKWLYISAFASAMSTMAAEKQFPTFWERWRSSVLSCGSAAATGVVIYLSGGTASFVVGAFAVNSAALCGMSLGKGWEHEAWQEFEQNGGDVFKAWLTLETAMSLADLVNGAGGAIGFLKSWKQAGKLARLEKVIGGKKLTRKQLLKTIQDIDPSFSPDLASKGAGYFSRSKLVLAGQEVLTKNKFISLSNQQARVIWDAVGNSFTLAGAPDTWVGIKKTYDIWLVQYEDKPDSI
jgi:peptidoglycan hydrolase-like protein with peptidoglycan-binding domain